ncbi:type VI secretion system tip protein VgrG [Entomomonas asaccharolytica]|uniref:Type VI secretion system tip protein VgrG n=1 Tax=Entomomonas asaccharolytica TaxID=2785331 RepID=A0A974NII0_9GAMM|nr:type VI secretion system tip protein VgrG [Entomomonas asaccharolytica]
MQTQRNLSPRDFCVQYDETDYHFVSRLCQEEGIAYHFQHTPNNHKMIFTDAMPFFPSVAEAVKFMNDTGMVADSQALKYFDVSLASRTQTAAWRDYNFTNMKIPEGTSQGQQSQKGNEATEPNLEHYDYPSSGMDKARNEQLAKIEIERLRTDHLLGEGYSDIPELHSGYYITIQDHPSLDTMDAEKPWLITQIRHKGYQPQVLEAFAGAGSAASTTLPSQLHKYLDIDTELEFPVQNQQQGYFNVFNAIPQEITYRPARRHPKSRIRGSQTAIVTGAPGEEIYCDEYGRIKVQFHWDREGTMDENSSHWIRVASNWAHNGYGTVVIPRVGMEVMVDFLEGDPDQPLIKGAVHNGVNKVPYELPANKTRSVFKTSSSKGGNGSNELRIEDKAGEEQIFVQAQKDFDQLTKNNHTIEVKNNSHLQVQNEHSETIVKNRYTKNEAEEHHLTQLDRKTQILMNDYKIVGMNEHETIGTIKTTEAGMEIHLKSGLQTIIDGGLSLTLKAGGQHIVLNPAGIWMTMPVFTGGVPMEGTPSVPMPPESRIKAVAATSAPIPRPLSIEQKQTLAGDAPFCLECMLAAMGGGCVTDFSNKITPEGVLDISKLSTKVPTGITNGGTGSALAMSSIPSFMPTSDGLSGLTTDITGQATSLLNDNPLTNATSAMEVNTNTLQSLVTDPQQTIQALTNTASQAMAGNEQLANATRTAQQATNLAKNATTATEQLRKTTTPKSPTNFVTGFNPEKGDKI